MAEVGRVTVARERLNEFVHVGNEGEVVLLLGKSVGVSERVLEEMAGCTPYQIGNL